MERPQRSEDERPWRRLRPIADCWPSKEQARSAQRHHPPRGGPAALLRRVRAGAQPYLGARTRRVRRQDAGWGDPECAAARSLEVVHGVAVAAGALRALAAAHLL